MHKHYICLPVNTSHTIRLMPISRCVHNDNTQVRLSHTIRQVRLFHTRRRLTIFAAYNDNTQMTGLYFLFFLCCLTMALVAFLYLFFLLQMVPPIEGAFLLQAGSWGVDTFADVFGISPRMCCIVWVRCRLRQEIPGVGVKHFLWALAFFRVYATQTFLRSMMDHPSRQVFCTWMWKVVKAIANAFEEVVS
jgi:hypothetical protein